MRLIEPSAPTVTNHNNEEENNLQTSNERRHYVVYGIFIRYQCIHQLRFDLNPLESQRI